MPKMGTASRKDAMVEALEKCLCNVTQASKLCGVSRHTHNDWFIHDTDYRTRCEALAEVQKDFVESQAMSLVKDKNAQMIIHFLKTKCRDRGYGDKIDIESSVTIVNNEAADAAIERMGGADKAREILAGILEHQ